MSQPAAASRKRGVSLWLLALLALFVVVHGGIVAYDLAHPTKIYDGDRGKKRANKAFILLGIDALRPVKSPTWSSVAPQPFAVQGADTGIAERLLNQGPPGDYVFHAGLYALGGPLAVILVQLALWMAAIVCVFRLCRLLGLSEAWAGLATLITLLLPASLYQPHLLVSEGLFNPLVAIALYLIVRSIEQPFRWTMFLPGLVLLALAMQVRTQLFFFPLLLAAILVVHEPRRWARAVLPTLAICYALFAAWAVFRAAAPPELATAPTELSPLRNLSGIVKRMSLRADFPFERGSYPGEQLPIVDFLGYVVRYPVAFLHVKATDVAELLLNPGITGLGRFFGIDLLTFKTPEGRMFWSQVKWDAGIAGVVTQLFRQDLRFVLLFVGAAALWAAFLLGALIGTVRLLRRTDSPPTGATKAILLAFVLYNIAIVQVGEITRATQRSPYEFILAILFVIGLRHLVGRRPPRPAAAG